MLKLLLLLLILTPPYAIAADISSENDLRTFFTSKQTRTQLNEMRNAGKYDTQKSTLGKSLIREPAKIKMQGVVIREGKKPVVFVNNENTIKTHHLSNDVTVRDHRIDEQNYKIPVRINDKGLSLKPGQQWSESDNKTQDQYLIKPAKEKTNVSDSFIKKVDTLIK